jgi:hypothetical protein
MRIVLATRAFARVGGSETYLLTVAEALERLGHEALIHANELGESADLARRRGVRVEESLDAADDCDAALAQDAPAAYEIAERFPGVPILFVCHSEVLLQAPPQLDGICPGAVALSERIATHLRALAVAPEITRLRQPVDLSRFGPLGLTRPRSKLVLAFGNDLPGGCERVIRAACGRASCELEVVGRRFLWGANLHPEREIGRAEIVIGTGRCTVEAMASGKAVYVYGPAGGDGWVTKESYPLLEAEGFSGQATPTIIDAERLANDLADFNRTMGQVNRDLAAANHDSLEHARALVGLWRGLGASSPPPTPAAELARLGRVQRQAEETAGAFAFESQLWRRQLEDLKASRRYRIGSALARPFDAVRRWRSRLGDREGSS